MKVIDIDNNRGVNFIEFPDTQPHANIGKLTGEVSVICSLDTPLKVLKLLEVSNALYHEHCMKVNLLIPYLMGARYDRIMQQGDSLDLQVIAGLINRCGFEKVILYDVHSEVSLEMIKNSISIDNRTLVESYPNANSVLVCPDAGARKKVDKYLEWNTNLVEIVYCNKTRDLSGKITIDVERPERCKGRNCVIIDDLCDGGGTFMGIASQIQPERLELIVTHGIFSKGLKDLHKYFDLITTSDSYTHYEQSKLIVIPLDKQQIIKETR